MSRRATGALVIVAAMASAAFAAGAVAQPAPPLHGTFQMSGMVTVARNVRAMIGA